MFVWTCTTIACTIREAIDTLEYVVIRFFISDSRFFVLPDLRLSKAGRIFKKSNTIY